MERINHMRMRLKFERMAFRKWKDAASVGSSRHSDIPRLVHGPAVDTRGHKQGSSVSGSSDIIDSDDPIAIPSLTKHLEVSQPKDF